MNPSTASSFVRRSLRRAPSCAVSLPTATLPTLAFRRALSSSPSLHSGHSRWSKIKHEKAATDAKTSKVRSYLSRELISAVKHDGPDPTLNARLAALLVEAKRADMPKAAVDRCMQRGQGVSTNGTPLESLSMEFMFGPVAGIVELDTDSRTRTTRDIKALFRKYGGAVSPSQFMFDRCGRLAWDDGGGKRSEEDVLESAIEAGALDVETVEGEDGDKEFVVWTEVAELARVAQALAGPLGAQPKGMQLAWRAKEDNRVQAPEEENFDALMTKLEELSEVQAIYLNVS